MAARMVYGMERAMASQKVVVGMVRRGTVGTSRCMAYWAWCGHLLPKVHGGDGTDYAETQPKRTSSQVQEAAEVETSC